MEKRVYKIFLVVLSSLFLGSLSLAQDYLQPSSARFAQEKQDNEFGDRWKFVFSSHFDGRLVATGKERNWQDPDNLGQGGRGLTRYGGVDADRDGDFDHSALEFRLSRLAMVFEVQKQSNFKMRAHIEFSDELNQTDSIGRMGFAEVFVARRFSLSKTNSLTFRFGSYFPEFSLEHTGLAWTTERSLTPSAVNTWFAEELRPFGLEFSIDRKTSNHGLGFKLAAFSRNDPMGALLHYRGWAFHDRVTVIGQRNRINQVNANPRDPSFLAEPFTEIDGRIAYYAGVNYSFRGKYNFSIYYLDNNSNDEVRDGLKIDYAWNTRFSLANIKLQPTENFEFLAQYISGETQMKSISSMGGIMAEFNAWYALMSLKKGKNRISLRYEDVEYTDLGTMEVDQFAQSGTAWTAAYFYSWNNQSLGVEFIRPETSREGNDGLGSGDPNDNLAQISYRLNY